MLPWRRLPRGGVDRNTKAASLCCEGWCRLPRGGVDRNHRRALVVGQRAASPPSRRRGSKRRYSLFARDVGPSPPSRRRGSKHLLPFEHLAATDVASLAEAWIETASSTTAAMHRACRLPRGGVDRNTDVLRGNAGVVGRLPRGGVDRNTANLRIEVEEELSPPSRRRGSKPDTATALSAVHGCRLLGGGVDRNSASTTCPEAQRTSPPSRRPGPKHQRIYSSEGQEVEASAIFQWHRRR